MNKNDVSGICGKWEAHGRGWKDKTCSATWEVPEGRVRLLSGKWGEGGDCTVCLPKGLAFLDGLAKNMDQEYRLFCPA